MKKILSLLLVVFVFTLVVALASCNITVEPTMTTTTTQPIENNQPIDEDLPHVHTETIDNAIEPTCTRTGLTEGKHCSECGEIIIKQESVPVIPHTIVTDIAVAPTCTSTGLTEGAHCSICNTVIAEQHEVPIISHKYDDKYDEYCNVCNYKNPNPECSHSEVTLLASKSATCTESGLTEGSKCQKCGEILIAQEVINPTGHGEYLKKIDAKDATFDGEGNVEYWECSKCGKCYNDALSTNEISKSSTVISIIPSYTIKFIYDLDQGIYEEKRYSQNVDLFLNSISVDVATGYRFNGWYDNQSFAGDRIRHIPAGNDKNYTLYAKIDPIEYTITYVDAPKNTNVTTYTIEDEITLLSPEWSGLSFKNWMDANGNIINKIEKGTVGDLILTANWLYEENLATSTADDIAENIFFDEEHNMYYFIYELGIIDNIVLGVVQSQDKNPDETISFGKSETISVEDSIADTIAKTVTNSVSTTSGWDESFEWAMNSSKETTRSISASAEVGTDYAKAKVEASVGVTTKVEAGFTIGYGKNASETSESGTEQSASSTVAYTKGTSTTVTASSSIDGCMPKGTYHYVIVGKVTVYAIVVYDVESGNYYLDTYSVMGDQLRDKRLYEAPSNTTANITTSDSLSFNIPEDKIQQQIESSYYVKYDANGGKGDDMLMSLIPVGVTTPLSSVQYSRDGYTFDGWKQVLENGVEIYTDEAKVTDLAAGGGMVILYAQWANNTYVNTFDPAGGSVSIPDMVVTYDMPMGELPEPIRPGYEFRGWTLDSQLVDANTIVNQLENKILVAQWNTNTYKVYFDPTGGTVSATYIYHEFDTNYNLPTPERDGYEFLGWYYNGIKINNDDKMVTAKDHTLQAKWLKIKSSVEFSVENGNRDKKITEDDKVYDTVNIQMDINELIAHGYTKLYITLRFDIDEIKEGYKDVWIYNQEGKRLWSKEGIETGKNWTTNTYEFTINLSDVVSGNYKIEWGAHGNFEDDWWLGYTFISMTAQK